MKALKTALGNIAVTQLTVGEGENKTTTTTPVPAFAYEEITDFALIKANLYYTYATILQVFFLSILRHLFLFQL